MRILIMVAALLMLAGCGDPHHAKRETFRNEVIAFRVASTNTNRVGIIRAFQKLETAIIVARADGLKFDPMTEDALNRMLAHAERARVEPNSDAALDLAAEATILEIYVTEDH